jgi:hypothetical protein
MDGLDLVPGEGPDLGKSGARLNVETACAVTMGK